MNTDDIAARLRRLPPILRARYWRLYAADGRRFLDLWQDGGRGMLGARHRRLGTALKAALDRGLDRPLPSTWQGRLERLLAERWPETRAVRLYADAAGALVALSRCAAALGREAARDGRPVADLPFDGSLILDPARSAHKVGGERTKTPVAVLARPFAAFLPAPIEGEEDLRAAPLSLTGIALPLLPLARGLGPVPLVFADPALAEAAGPSDLVPPLLLRAATDALAAMTRLEAGTVTEGGAGRPFDERHWRRSDRRLRHLFRRSGPWLFSLDSGSSYDQVFEAALARGMLLPPDPRLPGIVPGDFDDGELAALADVTITHD